MRLIARLAIAVFILPLIGGADDSATQPTAQAAPARSAAAVATLSDSDPQVRYIAQAALEEAADAALPALNEARQSDDPEMQRRATLAIAAITVPRTPT